MLSASSSPCRRYHPARVSQRFSQSALRHAAFVLRKRTRPPDLMCSRGYLCVHSRYGPVTRRPPFTVAVSMGFRSSVSLLPAIQATGLWLLPRRVCSPAERASLCWTHSRISRPFRAHGAQGSPPGSAVCRLFLALQVAMPTRPHPRYSRIALAQRRSARHLRLRRHLSRARASARTPDHHDNSRRSAGLSHCPPLPACTRPCHHSYRQATTPHPRRCGNAIISARHPGKPEQPRTAENGHRRPSTALGVAAGMDSPTPPLPMRWARSGARILASCR